ncbi:hypothetical protein J2125_000215 [Erwinia toletana]|uniref:Uncharacterized protein n=1 Tax=Winslowiella toletana TaxID=92490 RepID=A0ABS4P4Z2_9GAMM|nr:hypothetical protein [Winslowiella toletana]MBP2167023.1 hypothetical protein [Winslowiella toletana]
MKNYKQTLEDFEIDDFKVDLAIKNDDLAINDFGDLLLTDTETDSLYRFIQKWRFQEPTIISLFNLWKEKYSERQKIKINSKNWSLNDRIDNAEALESYLEAEAALAGNIFILLFTLISIPKKPTITETKVKIIGINIDELIQSSANNFRHYDEWSKTTNYTNKQLKSVNKLALVLSLDTTSRKKIITSNVCSEVLMKLSNLQYENLFLLLKGFIIECWHEIKNHTKN